MIGGYQPPRVQPQDKKKIKEYNPLFALPNGYKVVGFTRRVGNVLVDGVGFCCYDVYGIRFKLHSGAEIPLNLITKWWEIEIIE